MKMSHTPEPWNCNVDTVWRDDYNPAVFHPLNWPQSIADARRAVACVNACAGIDTEMLEGFSIGYLSTVAEKLYTVLKLNKELLEALKVFAAFPIEKLMSHQSVIHGFDDWKMNVSDIENARAATAKATAFSHD